MKKNIREGLKNSPVSRDALQFCVAGSSASARTSSNESGDSIHFSCFACDFASVPLAFLRHRIAPLPPQPWLAFLLLQFSRIRRRRRNPLVCIKALIRLVSVSLPDPVIACFRDRSRLLFIRFVGRTEPVSVSAKLHKNGQHSAKSDFYMTPSPSTQRRSRRDFPSWTTPVII